MKELTFTQTDENTYTADAYPLNGGFGFYSEYRIVLVGERYIWQHISVTWDDEDQITESVVAESAPIEAFFDAVSAANQDFQKG